MAAVWTDKLGPPNPANPVQFGPPNNPVPSEQVKLQINAQGSATYDQTGIYAILAINPTMVQGHIPIEVRVDVLELGSTVVSQYGLTTATLDTQVLTFQ